ncbi:MAG TPA: sigma-70 family RNA polymerase sigma factor, partial [Niabella sp.]|nr:sigma-70 family RNA polymerase sigma factor [Niabella sp.]
RIALVKDLKLYLFKAVKNASLNYLKSAVYKNSKLTGTLEDKDELYISPESEYIHSELQQLLLSAISRLPARCQMVFRLVKEYGLSYAQVSAVMDISQNTIETHMKLALKKLKAVLDSYRIAGK